MCTVWFYCMCLGFKSFMGTLRISRYIQTLQGGVFYTLVLVGRRFIVWKSVCDRTSSDSRFGVRQQSHRKAIVFLAKSLDSNWIYSKFIGKHSTSWFRQQTPNRDRSGNDAKSYDACNRNQSALCFLSGTTF
jgi:hypothetical protein